MSEFQLPKYDAEQIREIWFEDHPDFDEVEHELHDRTRWGHTESKVVRHVASGTFWGLTADVSSGDEGQTDVDDTLTRVYPREVTVTKYVTDPGGAE
jgi:hypothetical protein